MIRLRTFALAPLAALALSACDKTEEAALPAGEPIAKVVAPEGSSWRETVQLTDRGGYLVGNPEAPIKLVGPLIIFIFPVTFIVLGFPIAMKFLAEGIL